MDQHDGENKAHTVERWDMSMRTVARDSESKMAVRSMLRLKRQKQACRAAFMFLANGRQVAWIGVAKATSMMIDEIACEQDLRIESSSMRALVGVDFMQARQAVMDMTRKRMEFGRRMSAVVESLRDRNMAGQACQGQQAARQA